MSSQEITFQPVEWTIPLTQEEGATLTIKCLVLNTRSTHIGCMARLIDPIMEEIISEEIEFTVNAYSGHYLTLQTTMPNRSLNILAQLFVDDVPYRTFNFFYLLSTPEGKGWLEIDARVGEVEVHPMITVTQDSATIVTGLAPLSRQLPIGDYMIEAKLGKEEATPKSAAVLPDITTYVTFTFTEIPPEPEPMNWKIPAGVAIVGGALVLLAVSSKK